MVVSLKSTCFLQHQKCFRQQSLTTALPSSQKQSAVCFRSTKIMASLPTSKTLGISETFARLKEQNKVAFIPYITASDPDLSVTAEALKVLDPCGSDIIELGLPYSDPLADGPVIQAAATRVLARGTDFNSVLSMLRKVKILSFYAFPSRLCMTCGPDVPLEETEILRKEAIKNNIELVLLTTPTTSVARMNALLKPQKVLSILKDHQLFPWKPGNDEARGSWLWHQNGTCSTCYYL